jgi:serine/threonine protein kinase
MPTPDPDRDPLDVVAEEFADRCRRGQTPSVTEYVARHPALADDLRELLPAVAQMELLKKVRRAAPPAAAGDPPPARLGDFRIVRELGRGGMGVVYEAVQESLGRRVALKLLPAPARADRTSRERFRREATAAAKLHHTNIVPVFGVGEANGIPYYVMQYIPGCGLHDVIAGWRSSQEGERGSAGEGEKETRRGVRTPPLSPSASRLPGQGDWRAIARIALAAASALTEAHAHGVLHRDVKPANLLLDPRGHVWVTDFGLAKLTDCDTLTATGDVMGTFQYMAPEALRGRADERTDVYGLGMTMYELVTLRLPFDESNPGILVKEIAETDPLPPRQVNPRVPRDLETIVLTAIAREPGRRYASAAALAEDLEAFLDDRPIRARRLSPAGRGWRWCRRNPVVAGLSAVTAAALTFAAVFGWVMYARSKAALASASQALADESRQRAEAQAANQKLADNLALSLEALEKVFDAAARPDFGPLHRPGDGPPPVRPAAAAIDNTATMLEAVLEFYEKFAEQNATNPKLQFDVARAYRKVGDIQTRLGRAEKADAAFARSAALFDELHRQFPNRGEVKREVVFAYARLPVLRLEDPRFWSRLEGFRRAADAGDELRRRAPGPWPWQFALAEVYQKLGDMFERAARPADARVAHRTAAAIRPQRKN